MNINERIRFLRKEKLHITQEALGEPLGLTRANIANIESGRIAVTERVILSICEKFGVDEKWLRTGEGDPIQPLGRDIQIETFIGNVLRDESDNFKRRLISALCSLSEDEWEFLERKPREIVGTDENGTG